MSYVSNLQERVSLIRSEEHAEEEEDVDDVTYNSHDSGSNSGSYGYEDAISFTGYGLFHILLLFLCGWAVSSDAIEVLSISFILPSAEIELGLTSSDQGLLNAIIFLGMMFGGYLWGALADKLGRRSVLLGSLTVNGLGGLASSLSQPFWLFLLMRFISGIGVGGSIPVVFSYFAEFQPKHRRGSMISVLATFWMGGNIIAAGLAWIIIPHTELGPYSKDGFKFDSWRIFICVCTIPSLTSAFLFLWMPESPKFLLQAGEDDKAVNVLKQIHKLNSPKTNPIFTIKRVYLYDGDDKEKLIRNSVTQVSQEGCWQKFVQSLKLLLLNTKRLFRRDLRRNSIIMIIINFTLAFGYYGLFMWFPKLFARVEQFGGTPCDLGSTNASVISNTTTTPSPDYPPPPPSQWVFFSGFMTASSNLPGNILTIFLMDRIGRKPLLVISMVICGVSVFAIMFVQDKVQNLVLSCVFGGVSTAGWNTLDVLGAELFPTSVRSTAFGVQQVFNRIGAMLGNIIFGELIDVSCAIPLIMVAGFLIFGALSAIPLPNTTKKDIH